MGPGYEGKMAEMVKEIYGAVVQPREMKQKLNGALVKHFLGVVR
jgi:hypothetical protein